MFSYLRPHRRTPSTPASPVPDQTWENPLAADPIAETRSSVNPTRPSNIKRYTSPTTPTAPLAAIAITTSADDSHSDFDAAHGERDMKSQWMDAQIEQRMQIISLDDSPRYTQQNGRPTSEGTGSDAVKTARLTVDTSFTAIDYHHHAKAKRPTSTRFQTSPPTTTAPTPLPTPSAEPAPSRSTKARRTLLKPMSLLARRRTSHQTGSSSPILSSPKDLNPIAANELSIRGTVVHDFSAPRPRRNVSYTDIGALPIKAKESPFHHSPGNGESGSWNHTPAFTEDFDEQQYPAAGPHVRRASDLSDLHSPIPQYAKEARRSLGNTRSYSQSPEDNKGEFVKPSSSPGPPVPSKPGSSSEDIAQPLPNSIQATPDTTPDKNHNRQRNVSGASIPGSSYLGIPRHKSTSSRFSFDMVGTTNQEKILEDGYRKREAEKLSASPGIRDQHVGYDNEGDDGEFDYDAMMDDDGLEERIPGVNADLYEDEEEEEYVPSQDNNIGGFTFHPMTASTMTPSPNSLHPSIPMETPRNSKGDVIGFALSKDSPYRLSKVDSSTTDSPISPQSREMLANFEATFDGPVGLGLNGIDIDDSDDEFDSALKPRSENLPGLTPAASFPHPGDLDDDDLYFDDGIIAQEGDDIGTSTFDESLFDRDDTDQYGRPLKNLPPLQTNIPNIQPQPASEVQEIILEELNEESKTGGLAPQPSLCYQQRPSLGLTQDTLAAYQDALALAAEKAFASGKFNRRSSDSPIPLPENQGFSAADYEYDDFTQDDFDYDDALEDDPIIAAANAEALANDPEGFYGQEFGFYSAPLPAAGETEYAMGGYFGPRGIEGLTRSQSGRVPYGFREPNLTPITERSEYSARNSVMSNLNALGNPRDSTPGLAQLQLAGLMAPFDDEDLSLSRLMKARRGAWGGSQASASSDNGSLVSGHASPRPAGAANGHTRNDSALSGSAWSNQDSDESPRVSILREKRHRRGGSAESVSYVRDDERWVLERRRTAEDGGVEILGREVVVGGRI